MKTVLAAAFAIMIAAVALPAAAEDAAPGASPAGDPAPGMSLDQKGQIEKIVHDYLMAHPEVIKEAIIALQAKEEAQKADSQSQAVAAHKDALFNDAATPVAGNPIGDVTLVEFFDYHCPYCKAVAEPLAQLLKEDKGVRLVLKEFPILGDDSRLASKAALAAVAQGKYWEFHQALLEHRGTFDMDTITAIAGRVGLDAKKLAADMDDAKTQPLIDGNRKLADSLDVSATPTFVIGGQVVEGAVPLDQLRALIKKARGS
ncbi:MAG TPA: DsbA family protein [Dongiaceae bacterium]|nr:DsbA family protein [Dongiaceae bacterium]